MNLNFDINIGGLLELLDSSVLYAEEMILELGFGNTSYIKKKCIYIKCIMMHDENMTPLWWCYAVHRQNKHEILAHH